MSTPNPGADRGGAPDRPGVTVVIPTLNEADNIDPLMQRLVGAIADWTVGAEVLVVDDGSTDGTPDRVREWARRAPVRLIERAREGGLAGAVLAGARAGRGGVVVVMDADLSHPPERIPDLARPVLDDERDMVIGSRHAPGGSMPGWPIARRVLSRGAALLAWPLVDVRDPMSGFFAVRRDDLLRVGLDAKGYKIGLELLAAGGPAWRVGEVPIEFRDRVRGESKLDGGVLVAYLARLRALAGGDLSVRTASRFAVVGLTGLVIDLALFQTFLSLGWGFAAAHVSSFFVATLFNFALNATWSFAPPAGGEPPRTTLARYVRFLTVALLALALRGAVLGSLVEGLGVTPRLAILAAIAAVAVVNYFGATFYVFPSSGGGRADTRWRVAAVGVIGYVLALRLVYAGMPDLLVEEAYYWNYAQHPALSYLDHPPMVAWLIRLGTAIVGNSELGVRLGAVLCGMVTIGFVARLAHAQGGKTVAFGAALLAAALPFFFFTGFFMTPDAPLTAAWAGALFFLHAAMVRGRGRAWWGVGLCAGLGLLSKYTIALLGPATLVFLLLDPSARRWLRDPRPYLAALLAAALFTPVIVWNAQHGWASFALQSVGRIDDPARFSLHRLVGAAMILLTPVGVAAAVAGLSPIWRRPAPRRASDSAGARDFRFCAVFTLVPLSVFVLYTLTHPPKLNWTGPIWLAVIPLIASRMTRPAVALGAPRRWAATSGWPAMLAVCLVGFGGLLHYLSFGFPWIGYPDRFKLAGWRELAWAVEQIEERVEDETGAEPLIVGMDSYGLASELAFYRTINGSPDPSHDPREGVSYTSSMHLLAGGGLMYERWFPPAGSEGDTLILVGRNREGLGLPTVTEHFARMTDPVALRYTINTHPSAGYYVSVGYGYRCEPITPDAALHATTRARSHAEPAAGQRERRGRRVGPDRDPADARGGEQRRPRPAARVEDHAPRRAAGAHQHVQQRQRLLRGPAHALVRHVVDRGDRQHVGRLLHPAGQAPARRGDHRRIEEVPARVRGVEQDVVVLPREPPGRRPAQPVRPHDRVDVGVLAQQVVEDHPGAVRDPGLEVQQDRARRRQQRDRRRQPGLQPVAPRPRRGPAVGELAGATATLAPRVERRVGVDQAHRARRQRSGRIQPVRARQPDARRGFDPRHVRARRQSGGDSGGEHGLGDSARDGRSRLCHGVVFGDASRAVPGPVIRARVHLF